MLYLPYAALWAVGGTAVLALVDPRVAGWLPDTGVAVSVATMMVLLLMLRALDDIRDQDYDREHNPERPLARGDVTLADLRVLIGAGTVFVLLANAWRWPVMVVMAALLGYAFLLLWADRRLGWPAGDALGLGLLVNAPVQILINAYLYAGLLYSLGLAPSGWAVAGIAVAVAAFLHLELARKTTRAPRPGERTYVHRLGASGTAAAAVASAVVSVVLLVAAVRPWAGGTVGVWLAAVPLILVGWAGVRFWRDRQTRWPAGLAGLFLFASFLSYQLVNLVERVA